MTVLRSIQTAIPGTGIQEIFTEKVLLIGFAGKNGISSVKNWLIAIGVAAALLVFGDAFLQSIYVA